MLRSAAVKSFLTLLAATLAVIIIVAMAYTILAVSHTGLMIAAP